MKNFFKLEILLFVTEKWSVATVITKTETFKTLKAATWDSKQGLKFYFHKGPLKFLSRDTAISESNETLNTFPLSSKTGGGSLCE